MVCCMLLICVDLRFLCISCLVSLVTQSRSLSHKQHNNDHTYTYMLTEPSGACTSTSRTDWSTSSSPCRLQYNGASARRGRPTTSLSPVHASRQWPTGGKQPLEPPVNQVGRVERSSVALNSLCAPSRLMKYFFLVAVLQNDV